MTGQRLEQMAAYLLKQLEAGGQEFSFRKIPEKDTVNNSGKDIYFLHDNKNNALLLVADKYTNSSQNKKQTVKHTFSFAKAYNLIHQLSEGKCLPVFYKDGETFFRSPFNENLQNPDKKSLDQYEWGDKHQMIVFSPEEISAKDKQIEIIQTPALTYYQAASDRLEEMIVSYKFTTVRLEPPQWMKEQGYLAQNSKRLFLWNQELKKPGPIQNFNHRIKQA